MSLNNITQQGKRIPRIPFTQVCMSHLTHHHGTGTGINPIPPQQREVSPAPGQGAAGPTSLHTSMVPNTTCSPSKKLSPMMITMAPPVVHPSLGLMALMQGVAAQNKSNIKTSLQGFLSPPTALRLFAGLGVNPCSNSCEHQTSQAMQNCS